MLPNRPSQDCLLKSCPTGGGEVLSREVEILLGPRLVVVVVVNSGSLDTAAGVLNSSGVCAKKQILRLQVAGSLHI